ncbi:MAG: hypothetical protein IKF64_03565 [Eubacterium sp.]|nr:hypothetical protein [Eubacterium sp.]
MIKRLRLDVPTVIATLLSLAFLLWLFYDTTGRYIVNGQRLSLFDLEEGVPELFIATVILLALSLVFHMSKRKRTPELVFFSIYFVVLGSFELYILELLVDDMQSLILTFVCAVPLVTIAIGYAICILPLAFALYDVVKEHKTAFLKIVITVMAFAVAVIILLCALVSLMFGDFSFFSLLAPAAIISAWWKLSCLLREFEIHE